MLYIIRQVCCTLVYSKVLSNSDNVLNNINSASGNIQDIRRSIAEGEKYNTKLFDLLGDYCGKSVNKY
jgi:hypothetical protein